MVLRLLLLIVASATAQSAAADGWVFRQAEDGPKLGYVESGSSNFETLWFVCGSGEITVSAAAGNARPRSGRAVATLRAAGRSATIAGPVAEDDFDGVYSIATTLSRDDPVFSLLATGASVSYAAPGWRRPRLSTAGQRDSVARFLAACR